ncbi:dienelactone hydrolase family protein [Streptomyces sp. NPDC086787]|uniref:dienelactone hydrolase family protein n=1 Tax=Streptomyces sp. NPDC086787 TaxID=3365759 RepID=UPI00380E08D3
MTLEYSGNNKSRLWVRHRPPCVGTALITLHGGRADSYAPSRPWHLAALRMRPVLRAAASAVSLDHVLLGEVRYRLRGWNQGDPVDDVLGALGELRQVYGAVPVVLIGHSMGGRAALRASAHPQVQGVLALAPWLPADEPSDHLRGRRIVVVHGDRDRVTSARASVAYVERAREAGACAGTVLVERGDHAMVRRSGLWHRAVAEIVGDLVHRGGKRTGLAARCVTSGRAVML